MGSYIIKEAMPADAQVIMQLVDVARRTMHENGNPDQWPVGYPSIEVIDDDLQRVATAILYATLEAKWSARLCCARGLTRHTGTYTRVNG